MPSGICSKCNKDSARLANSGLLGPDQVCSTCYHRARREDTEQFNRLPHEVKEDKRIGWDCESVQDFYLHR